MAKTMCKTTSEKAAQLNLQSWTLSSKYKVTCTLYAFRETFVLI